MNAARPGIQSGKGLNATLGLADKIFSSSEERRFVAAVERGLEEVEVRLLSEMSFTDALADVTSRYLLVAGGKRVRPTLALLTAQLGDGNEPAVISAAAAIEITHLASLYHDDVMDEALVRRGVPSAQAVWGNSVAILTGDLLFARASKLVASLGEETIRLQSDTFERLCLGQLHETIGPRADEDPVAHYLQVLADKTGSLIAAAAQTGIILSGASREFQAPVTEFGEKIGIAFQLIDDVIDLSPLVETTGKEAGTDLRSGVSTLPMLYLRQRAETDSTAEGLLSRLDRDVTAINTGSVGLDSPDGADLTLAIDELRNHDVTRQTLAEAQRWAREAVEAIAPLPNGPVKKALTRFADSIVARSH